ncbi:hypothetical protein BT69DRAFT_1279271, partial [Atractiella rhizophila]
TASSDVPLGVSGFELEMAMELVLVRGAWRLASEDETGADGLHAGLRVPPSLSLPKSSLMPSKTETKSGDAL